MSDPYFPSLKDIMTAEHTLNDILVPTPLLKRWRKEWFVPVPAIMPKA